MSLLEHPSVALLFGALVSAFIVPRLIYWGSLREQRLKLALAAVASDTGVSRAVNQLLTTLELFHKHRSGKANWRQDHVAAQQTASEAVTKLYLELNAVAWWWYTDIRSNAVLLGIRDVVRLRRTDMLADEYQQQLIATTHELNALWQRFLRDDYDPKDEGNDEAARTARSNIDRLAGDRRRLIAEIVQVVAKTKAFQIG